MSLPLKVVSVLSLLLSGGAAAPSFPVWPSQFSVDFNETTSGVPFLSGKTTGKFYYDAAHHRSLTTRCRARFCLKRLCPISCSTIVGWMENMIDTVAAKESENLLPVIILSRMASVILCFQTWNSAVLAATLLQAVTFSNPTGWHDTSYACWLIYKLNASIISASGQCNLYGKCHLQWSKGLQMESTWPASKLLLWNN